MYTLAIQFYPYQPETAPATETTEPKVSLTTYRSLHEAMDAIQSIDMREFIPDLFQELRLQRQMKTAGILDDKNNVLLTVRYLDQYENIGMPPGIYLHIQPSMNCLVNFEKFSHFPLSVYKAMGPREEHFLLYTKEEVVKKQLSIIDKHYHTSRKVKLDRNSQLKH